jgi:hypothetical protein
MNGISENQASGTNYAPLTEEQRMQLGSLQQPATNVRSLGIACGICGSKSIAGQQVRKSQDVEPPVDLSISRTLEQALGYMADAEQELSALHDKLTGPGCEGKYEKPVESSVEGQSRDLCTRLARLVRQLRTINGKV